MSDGTSGRSRKDLACTTVATAYQKSFGAELKRRVVDLGEPFAIAQADTPHEIFHVMDIPLITNQWWSAYIAAKQLSNRYFAVLQEKGYPGNLCKYCSAGLACTLADDPTTAPWGASICRASSRHRAACRRSRSSSTSTPTASCL